MKKLAMLITLVVVLSVSCAFATDVMTTTAPLGTAQPLEATAEAPVDNLATDVKPVSLEGALPEEELILKASGESEEAIRIEPSGDVAEPEDGVPNDDATLNEVEESPAPADNTPVHTDTDATTDNASTETSQNSNSTVIGAVIAIVIVIAVIAIVYILQKK